MGQRSPMLPYLLAMLAATILGAVLALLLTGDRAGASGSSESPPAVARSADPPPARPLPAAVALHR